LKGRPITKKDLSEITNSDINSINDAIKELLEKKFIVKRKQKDGRSYWLSLSEKFFQTFAVSNEYLSNIGSGNNKQQ